MVARPNGGWVASLPMNGRLCPTLQYAGGEFPCTSSARMSSCSAPAVTGKSWAPGSQADGAAPTPVPACIPASNGIQGRASRGLLSPPSQEPVTTFADLKLSHLSLRSLDRAGFEHPTPIQARAIPPALDGRDVIGIATTGTGKTAAFLLPILERLSGKTGTRALVLAPTRELALQIGDELVRFGRGRHVRGAVVIGGVGMGAQAQALRDGHEVIVATPGRLVDHLSQGNARLERIEILVLDEADRMLDMGFKPQLTRILQKLPRVRQTLLFSATTAGEVGEFARSYLRDPVQVEAVRPRRAPSSACSCAIRRRSFRCCSPCWPRTRSRRWSSPGRSAAPIGSSRACSGPATRRRASTPTAPRDNADRRWRDSRTASTGCWLRPTSPPAAST